MSVAEDWGDVVDQAAPSRTDRPAPLRTVLFISTMEADPWGGSEELWAETAKVMAARGVRVRASVPGWSPPHQKILDLARHGVEVIPRQSALPMWKLGWRKMVGSKRARWIWLSDIEKLLKNPQPDLVVISEGGNLPPIELVELIADRIPLVTISHNNAEYWWPDDDEAARFRGALAKVRRCFFVSQGNMRLIEKMLGDALPNASVVRNPYNVDFDVAPSWPALGAADELRLASVGRIDPKAKGQDLLLEALAGREWSSRSWHLTFYGNGPARVGMERLIDRIGLRSHVTFSGHVADIAAIWKHNHILVQPSRHEGLPLSIIEAMLCARPVVATDVAGHGEVIADGVTGFLADAPTAASIANALERAWQRRGDLEQIGKTAARRIREIVPADPASQFADELSRIDAMRASAA